MTRAPRPGRSASPSARAWCRRSGLSALLAAEFALTGSDTFVRELAPISPFRIIVALGYDYDARPPPPPRRRPRPRRLRR